jgi:hypothetical protein
MDPIITIAYLTRGKKFYQKNIEIILFFRSRSATGNLAVVPDLIIVTLAMGTPAKPE